MKNAQENNKDQGGQKKDSADKQKQYDREKTQWQTGSEEVDKSGTQPSAEKSNISVNNEGKIGKAHDQWNNSNNNRDEQEQRNEGTQQGNQANGKTVNDPEIDAPVYDPEKTDKKLPRMEEQKKSNK